MDLKLFIALFQSLQQVYYPFTRTGLLRAWVPRDGAAYPVDPITAVYEVHRRRLLSIGRWLEMATSLGLREQDAWLLRYAADNRAPNKLKRAVMQVRKDLVNAIQENSFL